MSGLRQQFTFIDVTAQKKVNKTKVKSHAAGDANRRKRQEAVQRHQQEILRQAEQSEVLNEPIRRSQSLSTESSAGDTPSTQNDTKPTTPTQTICEVQVSSTPNHDGQERLRLQWKELYRDSWTVFQTSLTTRKLRLGKDYDRSRPSAWPPKRSSSDDSIPSTALIDSPFLLQSQSYTGIPRIDPPAQFERARLDLTQIQTFLRGKHDATWIHHIRLDPHHYQHDYEVGIWRECFFLAFDQLALGKSSTAFAIMDTAFGAATLVVKKQHPSLLYAMLEVMNEARNIQDSKLNTMIQRYLAQLTRTLFGTSHPVALLMESITTNTAQAQQWSESLFQAVVGLLAELFGGSHFQTLGTQFGSLRGCMNERKLDAARTILTQIENVWGVVFPPGCVPLRVLEIERARITDMTNDNDAEIERVLNPALDTFEELAAMTAKATAPSEDCNRDISPATQEDTPSEPKDKTLLPIGLRSLGRTLASGSYHALALYMYTHLDEIFEAPLANGLRSSQPHQIPFAAQVVQIMHRAQAQAQAQIPPARWPT